MSCLNPRLTKVEVLHLVQEKNPGVDLFRYCLEEIKSKKSLGCWNTDKETGAETIPGWVANVVKKRFTLLKECKTAMFGKGSKLIEVDIVGPNPLPTGHCVLPNWTEPGEKLRWNPPFIVLVPRD